MVICFHVGFQYRYQTRPRLGFLFSLFVQIRASLTRVVKAKLKGSSSVGTAYDIHTLITSIADFSTVSKRPRLPSLIQSNGEKERGFSDQGD
jgi:hypothetical protein